MNLSGLLLKSGRCPFSWNVFLLRASSKPDCLRLWEMCDPLLIFMGIPGIPKTLNKDFFFFLGSILLRTFMFVCTSPASRLLPCCSLSASRSWCLGQQRGELTRAHGPWTLTCRVKLLSCAQQHPERFTGKQVNVHKQRQGRWLSADVSVFLPSAECYSKLRAASVVRQRELYRGSLAVLLQTLILLRAVRRFQWLAPFIWPGCCPVCPCDHH